MNEFNARQIVLDTETTGLEVSQGHRIIEIGCVELIDRKLTGNDFHMYLNPEREIDQGAISVHGITNEFLEDKPLFADVKDDLMAYLKGAELVIHNAPFDVGFLDSELERVNEATRINDICQVLDSLAMAKQLFPGQRNNLDALCKRYDINNSHRELHGALLDAEILSDVYLAMTGGQTSLKLEQDNNEMAGQSRQQAVDFSSLNLTTVKPNEQEIKEHERWIQKLDESVQGHCVWSKLERSFD